MISSTFKAWRREARLTPNSFANSRSGGNLAPGTIAPVEIRRLMLPMSLAVIRVSAGCLRRVCAKVPMIDPDYRCAVLLSVEKRPLHSDPILVTTAQLVQQLHLNATAFSSSLLNGESLVVAVYPF